MKLRGAFALSITFAAGFAAHALLGKAEAKPAAESPYAAMGQLGRVLALIENEYVDPVDRTKLVNGAISGMVDDLDPHSGYLPPQEYKEDQEALEGKFVGVGIEVDLRDDMIYVLAPIEGSPAFKAGIRSGDRVLLVDGLSTKEVGGFTKLLRRMRGVVGSHVKLTILREGRTPFTLDLERAEVQMASVRGGMMDHDIAYVRLRMFQGTTHAELQRLAGKMHDESKTFAGVILDMRANPGGLVDQAVAVADEFMTGGVIYTERRRGEILEQVSAHAGGAFANIPVVVIVDDNSASAAELVAGALQDSLHATVVGTRTFGKGIVQQQMDLPGGAGLKLTIARYYTPAGHGVQGEGIQPDVRAETTTKPDGGVPQIHERDKPNSIESEGATDRDGGVTVTYDLPDGGLPMETSASVVPRDPRTSGNDPVLRIGYEVLLRKIGSKK